MGTNLSIVNPKLYTPTAMPLTPSRRELLWLAEGKKCHWCQKPTRLCAEHDMDQATVEHIIPRGKGGTNDPSNLTSACLRCNNRRSHESNLGLADGALLGKYKETSPYQVPKRAKDTSSATMRVPRTLQTEDILREQRDQAQKEISLLRKEQKTYDEVVKRQEGELKLAYKIVEDQEIELKAFKSLTVWKFIRRRLAEWMAP